MAARGFAREPPTRPRLPVPHCIFFVEDHAVMRMAVSTLLAAEADLDLCGTAGSAEEAAHAGAWTACDLLLTDVGLPDMDLVGVDSGLDTPQPSSPRTRGSRVTAGGPRPGPDDPRGAPGRSTEAGSGAARATLGWLRRPRGLGSRVRGNDGGGRGAGSGGLSRIPTPVSGMDGIALAGRFRAERPGFPVVVSASAARATVARAQAAGASAALSKAGLGDTLAPTLRRVLGGAPAEAVR